MPHKLPPVPFFRDSPKTDRVQEVALRVIVELPEWKMHVVGTATLITPYLAITAKHVLDDIVGRFGAKNIPGGGRSQRICGAPLSGSSRPRLQNMARRHRMDLPD